MTSIATERRITELLGASRHMIEEGRPSLAVDTAHLAADIATREYGAGTLGEAEAMLELVEVMIDTSYPVSAMRAAKHAERIYQDHGCWNHAEKARRLAERARAEQGAD